MVRIRKKSSKRGTTNQREKIKRKVAEHRHKSKKEAKKNVQWKSRKQKDPGIPNSMPASMRAQVLAEVAEQRRIADEDKRRRQEARKAARAADKGEKEGSKRNGNNALVNGTVLALSAAEIVVDEDDEAPHLAAVGEDAEEWSGFGGDDDKDMDEEADEGEDEDEDEEEEVDEDDESKDTEAPSGSKPKPSLSSNAIKISSGGDKKAKGTAQVKEGEEAYDFGMFFS